MSVIQPGKMDLTLVAYYGDKTSEIAEFLTMAQNKLTRNLQDAFEPYTLVQVHGTIIGLEGTRVGDHILNANYLQQRQKLRPMNLKAVFQILKDQSLLPFTIRIGGYKDGELYPFTSRGLHPFLRSFSIQGDIAVAIGWPCDGERYPLALDRLRRAFNKGNVLHKYHTSSDDIDNDFFFVLGLINRSKTSELTIQQTEGEMRVFLAVHDTIAVVVDREHLAMVAYVDNKLPTQTSRVYGLDEAEKKIDEIKSLYREVTT
jgi:hypothetical protein